MHRTQIYLDDEEADLLGRAAARTGASRSELIRRAIRAQYGRQTAQARLAAVRASAGTWHDRSSTGADHVDSVRGDLDERLDQLGLR
ncbi:MAG: ribbon-helix-helix domain-containing protein [Intrasporangium sp.]|uniref:ribbon-helix-helix domain-containing protein n=1 Tax=Intrasporangium sp. TaxID=1925024 RepID=UPI002649E8E9|nr:CopG family transcriptional regulator [Intrasporangium sp.]MDN5796012.1 ribbon-helix-helix domain-containing protein [Intrasporangium sp.]